MISLKEAIEKIIDVQPLYKKENVYFLDSLNRVLAEDIFSDVNMPPFNKSAMDGYACRKEDLNETLEVIEIIPAGKKPEKSIGKNQCAKIMTGAEVPEGADMVIMVEHTEVVEENRIRFVKEKSSQNICFLGEDVQNGDLVLKRGTLIKPKHIAVLASVGAVNPLVYKQPIVGIISTGSELVEPDFKPENAQIRNSNGHQMLSQTKELSIPYKYYGIVQDDIEETRALITKAIEECDLLLLSGGVSVGDYDFVPQILKELGIEIVFNKIAVKPGKHTTFAIGKDKYIIGVPGNPVSSFMQFELVVKPFIYHLMGYKHKEVTQKLALKKDIKRKKADREEYIPVMIDENGLVERVDYHGSAHIHAISYADGMISIDKDITELKAGELVDVRQI